MWHWIVKLSVSDRYVIGKYYQNGGWYSPSVFVVKLSWIRLIVLLFVPSDLPLECVRSSCPPTSRRRLLRSTTSCSSWTPETWRRRRTMHKKRCCRPLGSPIVRSVRLLRRRCSSTHDFPFPDWMLFQTRLQFFCRIRASCGWFCVMCLLTAPCLFSGFRSW